ncbi:MAG: hypothetical protein KAW00_01525 [Dehalococcoidia bacterium]|nr:hypothetical protein [Dehalococcoidia bacterium]
MNAFERSNVKRWKTKPPEVEAMFKSFGLYAFVPLSGLVWWLFQPEATVANGLLAVSGTMFAVILAVATIVNASVRSAIEYWLGRVIERPNDYPLAKERFDNISKEIGIAWLGSAFVTLSLVLSLLAVVSSGKGGCAGLWVEIVNSASVASLAIAICYFFLFVRRVMYIRLLDELRRLPPPPTK